MPRRHRFALIGAAVLFGALIGNMLIHPTGWLGSDDAAYYSAAEQLLSGSTIQRLHHHYARLSMILPIAGSLTILGHSVPAVILPTFLAAIGCIVAVVGLGRRLFGWSEGLLAGVIVATLPYFHVLSTAAYPDVHVCLWSALSVLLAIRGTTFARAPQKGSFSRSPWFLAASGVSLGLAVSSKVFAVALIVPLTAILLGTDRSFAAVELDAKGHGLSPPISERNLPQPLGIRGTRRRNVALFLCGLGTFMLFEGLFFAWAADDFLFPLHALLASQSGVPEMVTGPNSWGGIILDRLSLHFKPWASGWGLIGVLFWPVAAAGLLRHECRILALWMLSVFTLVAFVPVSLKEGMQPYPVFHGRHILPACLPFALCLARLMSIAACRMIPQWSPLKTAASLATLVVLGSFIHADALRTFRDRPSRRVGEAIEALVRHGKFQDQAPIAMTASTYWRFRILFPPQIRKRLVVAVEDGSPDWWRVTTTDIEKRAVHCLPRDSIVLGTPRQLGGQAEPWDYAVPMLRLRPASDCEAGFAHPKDATARSPGAALSLGDRPPQDAEVVCVCREAPGRLRTQTCDLTAPPDSTILMLAHPPIGSDAEIALETQSSRLSDR